MLGTVVGIVKGTVAVPKSDFIYTMGLYDYLSDRRAVELLRTLHASLRDGGTLLVANFTPSSHGRGYMECFMDWELTYRTEAEMAQLCGGLGEIRSYADPYGNVAYVEIAKD